MARATKGLRYYKVSLACIIAVWIAITLASSLKKSPALDEVVHFGAGLSYLQFHDFRINPEHPPLVKVLAALPVFLFYRPDMSVEKDNQEYVPWFESLQGEYGAHLLFGAGRSPIILMLLARIAPVLIGALAIWLAWKWGLALSKGNPRAGLVSAILLLTYPEFTGHARFLTFDVPTLTGCALIAWVGREWWHAPNTKSTIVFAVAVTVMSLAKLPVVVFSALVLTWLFVIVLFTRADRLTVSKWILLFFVTCSLAWVGQWAAALFRFEAISPSSRIYHFSYFLPQRGQYGNTVLGRLLHFAWKYRLIPETSLAVACHTLSFINRSYFLNGVASRTGWYIYFPETIFLKTPIPYLALTIISLITGVVALCKFRLNGQRLRYLAAQWAILLVPFFALFLIVVASRVNLGHRYVMFIYFPASVACGVTTVALMERSRKWKRIVSVIFAYLVTNFFVTYPHYETYFNELIRTPYNAQPYVRDSNIDWGQDMPLIAELIKEEGASRVNLGFFSLCKPQSYGINDYIWVLPNYPFALGQFKFGTPDPKLPSVFTLNALSTARALYPGMYDHHPDKLRNSVAWYAARETSAKP